MCYMDERSQVHGFGCCPWLLCATLSRQLAVVFVERALACLHT